MKKEQIIKKIKEIKMQVKKTSKHKIIEEKINHRYLHTKEAKQILPVSFCINTARRRLVAEVSYIMHPVMETQKEINQALLNELMQKDKELNALKKRILRLEKKR